MHGTIGLVEFCIAERDERESDYSRYLGLGVRRVGKMKKNDLNGSEFNDEFRSEVS